MSDHSKLCSLMYFWVGSDSRMAHEEAGFQKHLVFKFDSHYFNLKTLHGSIILKLKLHLISQKPVFYCMVGRIQNPNDPTMNRGFGFQKFCGVFQIFLSFNSTQLIQNF